MYIVPPYGLTSCDYIGDVTILSGLYDPSSKDSSGWAFAQFLRQIRVLATRMKKS